MWLVIGTLVVLALLALVLKVMERRASKDRYAVEDLSAIAHRQRGPNGPYGGGGAVDGGWGGAGDGGGGGW